MDSTLAYCFGFRSLDWADRITGQYLIQRSFLVDDFIREAVDDLFELLDHFWADLVLYKGFFHVEPELVEVLFEDRHALVGLVHVASFVVVGSAQQHHHEMGHCVMEVGDFADVFDVEGVEVVVVEHGLVEVGHY